VGSLLTLLEAPPAPAPAPDRGLLERAGSALQGVADTLLGVGR
jgi:hypothetical protein